MKLTVSQALELRESITSYVRYQQSLLKIVHQTAREESYNDLISVIGGSGNMIQDALIELGDMTKSFTGEECPIINGIFLEMATSIDTRKASSLSEIAFMYEKVINAGLIRLTHYSEQLASYSTAANDGTFLARV